MCVCVCACVCVFVCDGLGYQKPAIDHVVDWKYVVLLRWGLEVGGGGGNQFPNYFVVDLLYWMHHAQNSTF